jgi:type VI secretion system protein
MSFGLDETAGHRVSVFWRAGGGMDTRRYILGFFLIALVGCGLPKKAHVPVAGSRTNTRFTIQVNVADGANQNSPIPVDFVMIADKKLLQEVAKLSAKDWFERRVQIQRDFGPKAQVVSWEWVPGEHSGPVAIDVPGKTIAAFLFAQYLNAGEHRAAVNVKWPVAVNLGAEEFSVQPLK